MTPPTGRRTRPVRALPDSPLPANAALSTDRATVALAVASSRDGGVEVVTFDAHDFASLYRTYTVLHWAFGGATPVHPFRGFAIAGLIELAKVVTRLPLPRNASARDKDFRNLRRANVFVPSSRPTRLPAVEDEWAVYRGLQRVGFARAPKPSSPEPNPPTERRSE